jgi:hypothetical protein
MLFRQCDKRTNASLMSQHAEYRRIAYTALGREGGELAAGALHFGMRPPSAHQERSPAFGKEHAPRAAFEELDAELAFQLVNRTRNRGLGAKQGGTRPIHAALIGNREERSHVAQLRLHRFSRRTEIGMATVYPSRPRDADRR